MHNCLHSLAPIEHHCYISTLGFSAHTCLGQPEQQNAASTSQTPHPQERGPQTQLQTGCLQTVVHSCKHHHRERNQSWRVRGVGLHDADARGGLPPAWPESCGPRWCMLQRCPSSHSSAARRASVISTTSASLQPCGTRSMHCSSAAACIAAGMHASAMHCASAHPACMQRAAGWLEHHVNAAAAATWPQVLDLAGPQDTLSAQRRPWRGSAAGARLWGQLVRLGARQRRAVSAWHCGAVSAHACMLAEGKCCHSADMHWLVISMHRLLSPCEDCPLRSGQRAVAGTRHSAAADAAAWSLPAATTGARTRPSWASSTGRTASTC